MWTRGKTRAIQVAAAAAALGALCAVVQSRAVAQEKLSARQVMDKLAEHRKLDGSEAVMTMVIYNEKGQKRVRKLALATKLYDGGKTEKKVSRFLAPADVKGTGLLTYDYEEKDDDIWIFMPALRKSRRIVSSEKSKSFMGSEFSYWDMNIPNLDDYRYKMLKEEKMGGADCWVVESVPKNEDIADEAGYSKRLVWVGKKDFAIRRSDYYDLDDQLLKVLTAKNIKLIDPQKKRYRPMVLEMVNKQNGRRSTMTFDKIELSKNVSDDHFTTRYLERP